MDCKKRIKHPGKSNRPIRAHGIKINPNYLQQKQQELTTGAKRPFHSLII
jgi:hypothetical protein